VHALSVGTVVELSFVAENTMLSNQAGTSGEAQGNQGLILGKGGVTVVAGAGVTVVRIKTTKPKASERGVPGKVRITRSGNLAKPLKVVLKTRGAAKSGRDYVKIPKSVIIKAKHAWVDVVIRAVKNAAKEKAKLLTVALANSKKYAVMAPGAASVMITD
jgi:hypothetical protein